MRSIVTMLFYVLQCFRFGVNISQSFSKKKKSFSRGFPFRLSGKSDYIQLTLFYVADL